MDVKISNESLSFKLRANCVIVNDDKVLMLDLNKNGFLCCPGGHVHVGEDTREAVIRETKEEVEIESDSQKLIGICENFFSGKNGKKFHEISFYYLMENPKIPPEKLQDYSFIENDEGKLVNLDFYWIPLKDVDKYDIRPKPLKEILKNRKFDSINHFLVKN